MGHLVVSLGDPGDLSGNAGAMAAMGFTQTEIERCLDVMVHEALCREHIPQDLPKFVQRRDDKLRSGNL